MRKEPKDPYAHFWTTTQITKGGSIIPPCTVQYDPIKLPDFISNATSVTSKDGARVYEIDGQKFPSITTLLKATDKEGRIMLAVWRKRLGKEAAQKVSNTRAKIGTNWHEFAEKYLKGEKFDWRYFTEPGSLNKACQLANALNDKIDAVIASEIAVYSNNYKVAGRMDVAARLKDGRLAVIDFKSGMKAKKANRLKQAGVQCTFYADALTEHMPFGSVDTSVVIQILPDSVLWQESDVKDWRPFLLDSIKQYATLNAQPLQENPNATSTNL